MFTMCATSSAGSLKEPLDEHRRGGVIHTSHCIQAVAVTYCVPHLDIEIAPMRVNSRGFYTYWYY